MTDATENPIYINTVRLLIKRINPNGQSPEYYIQYADRSKRDLASKQPEFPGGKVEENETEIQA
jgi:8-oxo-dGTP pyrophosphatase MutT (NUDIX family)